jgi:hypothetical protein
MSLRDSAAGSSCRRLLQTACAAARCMYVQTKHQRTPWNKRQEAQCSFKIYYARRPLTARTVFACRIMAATKGQGTRPTLGLFASQKVP